MLNETFIQHCLTEKKFLTIKDHTHIKILNKIYYEKKRIQR